MRHRCILCRCGRCLRPQFPFGVQPVIDVVAIPATSRAVKLERPAGDGVISRLGCRVGSDARPPSARSRRCRRFVSRIWSSFISDHVCMDAPLHRLQPTRRGERFLHDSAGFVSYCSALSPWTPPKRRDEWTRVRRSDVTRARSQRLERRKRIGDRPRRTIATLRRCSQCSGPFESVLAQPTVQLCPCNP